MPKVSVVLISYNHAKYLREAIESVLSQTYEDFELIIWDDASKDDSWSIIKSYDDKRIRAFRNEEHKRGIWGLNKSISEICMGEYIAIHHSDDVWEPEKLARQVEHLDNFESVGAIFTQVHAIGESGDAFSDAQHFYYKIFDQDNRARHEWLRFFFLKGNALCHPSAMVRKSCFDECGLYRYGFAQLGDFDMWIRICLKHEIYIIPRKLTRFRVRAGEANASGNRAEGNLRGYYEFHQILNHYAAIDDFDELVKIFPEASKYKIAGEANVKFALANIVLELKPIKYMELFALDILFLLLQDKREALEINRLYGFEYKDFIELTGEHDPFGVRAIDVEIEKDRAVAEKNDALAEIDRLKLSKSWKLTMPLRLFARTMRYGLLDEDKSKMKRKLKAKYHALPLPENIKKINRIIFHKILLRSINRMGKIFRKLSVFQPPKFKPATKRQGLSDYIIFGVIDWHFRYQRPQQLAIALRNKGYRVFYVTPNQIEDSRPGFSVEDIDGSGLLYQVKLFSAVSSNIYSSSPGIQTVRHLRKSLGELIDWADLGEAISLVQHPYWYDMARVVPNSRLVYDCMDHHEGFNNTGDTMLKLEKALLTTAELTITTSAWLDKAVEDVARNRALIRNAGEFSHFSVRPDKIYSNNIYRKIIGYYGAIAEWFDQGLLEAIASHFSDCEIVLIGNDSVNARARLGKYSNITFLGEIPYRDLPKYLYAFDVCLLPFLVLPLTKATNPVKIYEYLSAGKPVVAIDLPEMAQFGDLIYTASSHDDFISTIDAVFSGQESKVLFERRRSFASNQTWGHRAEELIKYAEVNERDPKISIVVVTYNNLDLTKKCLFSIDKNSDFKNLEIIVVDNASADETPDYLKEWEKSGENRTVILNEENRGFAAGNNQGLESATGDYLVMLNNDTYVTPGWIRTLVSHIESDSSIGLIGPVTNNIGNEAKIDIQYSDMEDMQLKASEYTRRHLGEVFPIRTAAFFCVMIPREIYEIVGPLDEAFGRGFFEDDDYCRRIEQIGRRIVCAEDVFVHHHLSASFNKLKHKERQKLFEDNLKIYEEKWGKWIPHSYRNTKDMMQNDDKSLGVFADQQYFYGACNICGQYGRFFFMEEALWRETLNCEHCRSTSRYRSIASGVLRAINDLSGLKVDSLAGLPAKGDKKLRVYDTQPSFYYSQCAYPLPDLLKKCRWIDVYLSQYKQNMPLGVEISAGVTNQNLEHLMYDDGFFDIVVTSDVMEHVRLDDLAHKEIHRVLKKGGYYVFTVPHSRSWNKTQVRVEVVDPGDPSKDKFLMEPEYHGDTNSDSGEGVLSYRAYGLDLDKFLDEIGFDVKYIYEDDKMRGILKSGFYVCKKR